MTSGTDGPYFDELEAGQVFAAAPAVTLTSGLAATHQSILGDRLRIALDAGLARATTGRGPLAHPALVWNTSIGQSTLATRHVKANLFYRGLALRRLPALGDTLRTVTTVAGLRQNAPRAGRAATGLAALRVHTVDQQQRTVLDFLRCAMIPLRDPDAHTGHADDLAALTVPTVPGGTDDAAAAALEGWDAAAYGAGIGARTPEPDVGQRVAVAGGDVVSSAPELARLTLNLAQVHHDGAAAGGRRLVYGGHTIGVALAQICRVLPDLATVIGWDGCDHLAPVHEGDTLRSWVEITAARALDPGWRLLDLRCEVRADPAGGEVPGRPVLAWALQAATPA